MWIRVPPKKRGNPTMSALTDFGDALRQEMRERGIVSTLRDLAQIYSRTADDSVVRRTLEAEQQAYNHANRVWRLFENSSPLTLRRFTRQELWEAVFFGHCQNSNSAPILPDRPGRDLRDYLCGETVEGELNYLMHGEYPVTIVSMFIPPNEFVTADALRSLIGRRDFNLRHTIVTEYLFPEQRKETRRLDRRIKQVKRTFTRKDNPEGAAALRSLWAVREEVSGARESLLPTRFYVLLMKLAMPFMLAGIEKYSAEAAASINRQAETTQYNAGYQADMTRSAGQWEAGNLRAQGQRTAQLASIQAALTGQVAATQGNATTQRLIIQASAGFQKSQVGAEVARNVRDTNIGASLAVGNIVAGAKRNLYMNAGNTSAAKIDQGVSLANSMIPPEIPIARGLIEIPKYDAITKRNRTGNEATTEFSAETVQNQETNANRIVFSAQQYEKAISGAIDKQAGEQVAGVNAGAGQAIGGYQPGANQAGSGVDQNYQLELAANRQVYTSQVDAAGQIRSAGLEAAKLRQTAAVIAAVGREISREVGQGMRVRF